MYVSNTINIKLKKLKRNLNICLFKNSALILLFLNGEQFYIMCNITCCLSVESTHSIGLLSNTVSWNSKKPLGVSRPEKYRGK